MSDPLYIHKLYPFQDEALQIINQIETGFYLTGGTAASRGYLNHRYSDDLDFFVNDDINFGLWADRVIKTLNTAGDWELEIVSRYDRFVRLNLVRPETTLKLELINDVPSRVGQVTAHPTLGKLDSAENILANKLTALITRQEPKDLADVWGFCCQMNLSLKQAITGAQGKAAGIFPADLSRVLLSTSKDDFDLIRWIHPPSANDFIKDLHKLGENLILVD
ncbi:MAG: nucleotidyl transferase AbiEii/AbiGii toxin family protein [Chloroflexota bacterium]|nr:nucleotidyl transferase AbiEii/AbiGii toxin family protein [Chloroflexota bacterium]